MEIAVDEQYQDHQRQTQEMYHLRVRVGRVHPQQHGRLLFSQQFCSHFAAQSPAFGLRGFVEGLTHLNRLTHFHEVSAFVVPLTDGMYRTACPSIRAEPAKVTVLDVTVCNLERSTSISW